MSHHGCRHPVRGDHRVRGLRRRRLRRRLLGPRRRGHKRGERPREVIDHADRPGLGGQPRLADLRLRAAVDLLPGGLRLDHPDPLRAADPRRARHRAAGASFAFRKAVFRTRDRRNFGAAFAVSSVLVPYCFGAVVGGIASGRVPAGARRAIRGTAGSTRPPCSAGVLAVVPARVPGRVLPGPRRRPALRRDDGRLLPPPGHRGRRSPPAWCRWSGSSCCPTTPSTSSTASPRAPCRWWSSPPCAAWPPSCWSPARVRRGARLAAVGRGRQRRPGLGRGAVGLPAARVADRLRGGRAVGHDHGRAGRHGPRGGADRARLRAALRAGPEVAAARGGHARARARTDDRIEPEAVPRRFSAGPVVLRQHGGALACRGRGRRPGPGRPSPTGRRRR